MNISATGLPNFISKYYLLHELLIFKIDDKIFRFPVYILQSDIEASSPQSTWDSASVNSWNTRLHHSSSMASQQSGP